MICSLSCADIKQTRVFGLPEPYTEVLTVEHLVCSLGHCTCSLSVLLLPPLGEGRCPPPWQRCGRAAGCVGAAGSHAVHPCPLCPVAPPQPAGSPPPRRGGRGWVCGCGCAVPGHTQSEDGARAGGCAFSPFRRCPRKGALEQKWARNPCVCLGARNCPPWGGQSVRGVR